MAMPDDAPATKEAPSPEGDVESSEYETFEDQASFLAAQGIEGYASVAEFKEAEVEAPFEQLKQILGAWGYKTEAKNYAELNEQFMSDMMSRGAGSPEQPPQEPPERPRDANGRFAAQPSTPSSVDAVFEKYGERLDEENRGFYKDFADAVASSSGQAIGEVQSRLQVLSDVSEMMLAQTWYNAAKAQAGEDPVPTFAEARAMMQATPQGRDAALFRMIRFGDTNANPMNQIFNVWRAGKGAGGVTKGEAAKRDASAKKIAIMKGMLKATPPTRAATNARSLDERRAFLDNVDFDSLT
jgi:hypothetical protein